MINNMVDGMYKKIKGFILEPKERISSVFKQKYIKTYSQCGEDVIISYALNRYKIVKPYYVDIGAHDPFYLSNSAFFYEKGASGICVEADPDLFVNIKRHRTRDVCLNCAVSTVDEKSIFYRMAIPTLNTLSKEEACRLDSEGLCNIKEKLEIDVFNINTLLKKYAKQRPNLISIDVEGVDDLIIDSLNFELYRPEVLCVETLEFSGNISPEKNNLLIEKIISKGYEIYADTFINTIFTKK